MMIMTMLLLLAEDDDGTQLSCLPTHTKAAFAPIPPRLQAYGLPSYNVGGLVVLLHPFPKGRHHHQSGK